jgi:hypothetical protein
MEPKVLDGSNQIIQNFTKHTILDTHSLQKEIQTRYVGTDKIKKKKTFKPSVVFLCSSLISSPIFSRN